MILAAGRAAAADSIRLKLSRSVELKDIGVRIRPFDGCLQTPPPPAEAVHYTMRPSGEQLEAYTPLDLWRSSQNWAYFVSRPVRISVVEARDLPPSELRLINNQHVRMADWQAAQAQQQAPLEWDEKTVDAWLAAFVGHTVAERQELKKKIGGSRVTRVLFTGQRAARLQGYVLAPRFGETPLLVLFSFPAGPEIRMLDSTIDRCLSSLTRTRKTAGASGPAERFQGEASNRKQRSPQFEQTRQRVIRNLRNLSDWWYVETENYVLAANLEKRQRRLVLTMQKDIEAIRAAYSALFPAHVEVDAVSVVRVFNTREEYEVYVGPRLKWTGGVWMPGKEELVIAPSVRGRRRTRDSDVLSVTYHEGFHQYVFYALNKYMLPAWADEGHASLFEACKMTHHNKRVEIHENEDRLATFKLLLKDPKRIELQRLMEMTRRDFYANADGDAEAAMTRRRENYALSWALVYFLRKAGPLYRNRRYTEVCPRMVKALVDSRGNTKAATAAALDAVDAEQLRADFLKFWRSSGMRGRAERHSIFAAPTER
jgi:hypothetical protein